MRCAVGNRQSTVSEHGRDPAQGRLDDGLLPSAAHRRTRRTAVPRGAKLGWTSTRSGCGGFASGAHLHFSLKWQGDFINLRGNAIGGWTVREGDVPYAGCLVRDGVRRCAPKDSLMNRGADRRRLKGTASRYRVTSRDSSHAWNPLVGESRDVTEGERRHPPRRGDALGLANGLT